MLRKLTTGPYGELWSSTFVSRRRHAEWMKTEMITIRFAGWMSGWIASLLPDTDIPKLLSNRNRIWIRISETLLSIFRGFRLLEKVAQSFTLHLESSEAAFQAWSYDDSKSYLCCNLSLKISNLELCSVCLIDGVSSHNAFAFYLD